MLEQEIKQVSFFQVRANKSQLDQTDFINQHFWETSVKRDDSEMPGFLTATFADKDRANSLYDKLRNRKIAVTKNWINNHDPMNKKQTGVLTSEEAFERAKITKTLVVQSFCKSRAFFFSDNHCFSYNSIDQDCLVPSAWGFPTKVVPRVGLENGVIDTIEKYIFVFRQDSKQLSSLQEVLNYSKSQHEKPTIN